MLVLSSLVTLAIMTFLCSCSLSLDFSPASLTKLFLPLQSVAPSKLPSVPSPPPSVLCPWVTSSADVDVIITSVPAIFKILIYCWSSARRFRISLPPWCCVLTDSSLPSSGRSKKELIKKQTQQQLSLPLWPAASACVNFNVFDI